MYKAVQLYHISPLGRPVTHLPLEVIPDLIFTLHWLTNALHAARRKTGPALSAAAGMGQRTRYHITGQDEWGER
eukprot:5804913-Prymnesium_polylepis.1